MTSEFRIDASKIMHENIDGEVIIVNLANGLYYSTEGVGTRIWEGLTTGHASLDSLIAETKAAYIGDANTIATTVADFVQRLVDEKLIESVPGCHTAAEGLPLNTVGNAAPFAEPVLHKYKDMEALLLVDPIHEVLEDGWPHVKA